MRYIFHAKPKYMPSTEEVQRLDVTHGYKMAHETLTEFSALHALGKSKARCSLCSARVRAMARTRRETFPVLPGMLMTLGWTKDGR